MNTADDVVVIVKTAGERTASASLTLLREQLPAERILVVDERESVHAIRRTYELGVERSACWTMTLGADALVRRGAVTEFVAEATRMPSHYFQIEARIFDKFTGLYRQAGQRIYRTALLRDAMPCVPQPGASMSSEYSVLLAMGSKGHPSRRVSLVVGLHDFEQYYHHIYVSAVVHAVKSPQLVPLILNRCLTYADRDADFRVVLWGLYDGFTKGRAALTESGSSIAPCLSELGLTEKVALDASGDDAESFWRLYQRTLQENIPPRFDTSDEPAPTRSALKARWNVYGDRVMHQGWRQATVGSIGTLLRRAGERLEAIGMGAKA